MNWKWMLTPLALREPVKAGTSASQVNCLKTDYYQGVGWLSPDWFSDQPTLEACLAFCGRKRISSEQCPCNEFHKGAK